MSCPAAATIIFAICAIVCIICTNILPIFRKSDAVLTSEITIWHSATKVPLTNEWIKNPTSESNCKEYRINFMVSQASMVASGIFAFAGLIFTIVIVASTQKNACMFRSIGVCFGLALMSAIFVAGPPVNYWFQGFCRGDIIEALLYPPLKEHNYAMAEGALALFGTVGCLLVALVLQCCV